MRFELVLATALFAVTSAGFLDKLQSVFNKNSSELQNIANNINTNFANFNISQITGLGNVNISQIQLPSINSFNISSLGSVFNNTNFNVTNLVEKLNASVAHLLENTDLSEKFDSATDKLDTFLPFLTNTSTQARTAYFLLSAQALNGTIADYQNNLRAWAKQYGLTAQIDAFDAQARNMSQQAEQNATRVVTEMAHALEVIKAIGNNTNQTFLEMHNAVETYVKSLDPTTQEVVAVLFKSMLPPQLRTAINQNQCAAVAKETKKNQNKNKKKQQNKKNNKKNNSSGDDDDDDDEVNVNTEFVNKNTNKN